MPTPLGNLRDITLRALDVLRACDLLIAEDTRVARKLLSALDLPGKSIWSYREQNAAGATAGIIERARLENVAVVSDAGMPGISDPGSALVAAARVAGVTVEVLPGPCAFITAAVLSGFDLRRLNFEGFVPRAAGERERLFRAGLASGTTIAFYESPHRIVSTLEALAAIAPNHPMFLVRELSKRFEQQLCGTAKNIVEGLVLPVRGEIVLVVGPGGEETVAVAHDVDAAIDAEIARGSSPATIARTLARRGFGNRRAIYDRLMATKLRAEQSSSDGDTHETN